MVNLQSASYCIKKIRTIQTRLAGAALLSSWDWNWDGVVKGDGGEAQEGDGKHSSLPMKC